MRRLLEIVWKKMKRMVIAGALILSGFLMCMWAYELNRTEDYQRLLVDYFKSGVEIEDCISVDEPGQVRVCLVRVENGSYYVTKLDRVEVRKSDRITKSVYYTVIKGN